MYTSKIFQLTPDKIMSSLEYFQGQNLIGLHITITQVTCLYRTILKSQHKLVNYK